MLAALVATGLRWTPLLAVIGATPLLAGNRHRLFEPEQTGEFLAALFITAMVILVIVGGVRATRENYRRPRRAPR